MRELIDALLRKLHDTYGTTFSCKVPNSNEIKKAKSKRAKEMELQDIDTSNILENRPSRRAAATIVSCMRSGTLALTSEESDANSESDADSDEKKNKKRKGDGMDEKRKLKPKKPRRKSEESEAEI